MIKRIISYIQTLTLYPGARAIVTFQSEYQRLKTLGQKPKVHFEAPYEGQRIMVLALYEKGVLRPDVIRLMEAARAEGLYVLAVNTLKLGDPSALQGLVDCYIERPNFGRDFGSYKTGFLHIFKNNWQESCPRLLMINDSVFFSAERMPKFLNDMMTSEIEVLGSTENYEIEYHLGSFCIAMSQSVLKKPIFQKYWKNYRLTDVRPRVIKRGEMKLSKTLKKCISAPTQLRALYGSTHFLQCLNNNPDLIDFVIQNSRTSDLLHWDQFNADNIVSFLRARFLAPVSMISSSENTDIQVNAELEQLNEEYFVYDSKTLKDYIFRHVRNTETIQASIVNDSIISNMTQIFMNGSQIHQNASPLLYLGLPIVKLDGMYRGMFNVYDIQRISRLLETVEADQLQQILMERPFGGSTLIGWKKAAFLSGLI
ncbi:rhamnan synthesis F family protein [uncultured Lentibacter sp.]|uniref:rhamnan synthesis F family protein n=1 Tax=uncultured Lentibacter sp. TaxID=1659309 RepID=UPI00262ACCA0|nr:rhamnan synthesis F family protein [uncultured Lentibacter sp.]